jgi:hypothetical protein
MKSLEVEKMQKSELPRLRLGKQPAVENCEKAGPKEGHLDGSAPLASPPAQQPEAFRKPEGCPFLELVFDVHDKERSIQILQRPLGAEFSKRRSGHTKISNVHADSYALDLGLEVGWVLKSIGGEDVSSKAFEEQQEAFRHGLEALPVRLPHV